VLAADFGSFSDCRP